MKPAYSNQFSIRPKLKKLHWSLWYGDENILTDVPYAMCVWKKKELKRKGNHKIKEFIIN